MADQLDLHLNGEARQTSPGTTIAALLASEGLAERRVAVEVNGAIVPRARHPQHVLMDGDRVEIVHALGGG
jgi:sulfur carrier protein